MTRRLLPSLLATTAFLLSSACTDQPAREYGDAVERVFLRTCTEGEDGFPRALCNCAYDRISEEIPFDEYEDIDRQLQGDDDALPDEIVDIMAACSARVGDDDSD